MKGLPGTGLFFYLHHFNVPWWWAWYLSL